MRGLYKRGNVWWIGFSYQGRRYREGVGSDRKQAEALLAKRKVQARENRLFDVKKESTEPFDTMAVDYLRYSEVNKRSYERDVRLVKNLAGHFGGKRLCDITPAMVEQYKAARSRQVKAATVNRELACLKHLFTMAIKWDRAMVNPVKEVRFFPSPVGSLRVLSREEEQALLDVASPHLRAMIITALNTGMRRGEVLGLMWEDVDFANGYLTVRKAKNGEVRQIPMSQHLTGTLKSLKRVGPYVHSKKRGVPYGTIVHGFRKAVEQSGIRYCRFHDLRHTFASRLVMAGVDLVTVKELLGHKSLEMTMRYSHPAPEHKRWAVETLNLNLVPQFCHSAHKSAEAVLCRKTESEDDEST